MSQDVLIALLGGGLFAALGALGGEVVRSMANRKKTSGDAAGAVASGAGQAVAALEKSIARLERELSDMEEKLSLMESEQAMLRQENVSLLSRVSELSAALRRECPTCGNTRWPQP